MTVKTRRNLFTALTVPWMACNLPIISLIIINSIYIILNITTTTPIIQHSILHLIIPRSPLFPELLFPLCLLLPSFLLLLLLLLLLLWLRPILRRILHSGARSYHLSLLLLLFKTHSRLGIHPLNNPLHNQRVITSLSLHQHRKVSSHRIWFDLL